MDSLYRQILKKAWAITRKYPALWLLGFFVAFLGNGGEYQILFNQITNVSAQNEIIDLWKGNLNALVPKLNLSAGHILSASVVMIIGLAIIAAFLWLIISSLGGLILGSVKANGGEKASFGTLLKAGGKKFTSILGLNIVAKAIVYGMLILVLTPLMYATFAQGHNAINLLIILLTFLIFIPLTIIVSLVTKYASAYVMLNGEKFWSAFKNGWQLFTANWLVSLEMALILFVINLGVGLVFILFLLLLFSPFFFFGVIYTIALPNLFNTLMYVSIGLILLTSFIVGALLSSFQVSSWTMMYLRLTSGEKAYSKLVRWVAVLPEKFKRKEA
ncbi:MAG: hypothetical protein NTZ18_02100 [Candidatus Komeilibacteria bacterium]|nr:hypothetical protein [Candidatus Komeilibacteria bacterium]